MRKCAFCVKWRLSLNRLGMCPDCVRNLDRVLNWVVLIIGLAIAFYGIEPQIVAWLGR